MELTSHGSIRTLTNHYTYIEVIAKWLAIKILE